MVLLHLLGVYNAKIPANRYTISMPPVCPFELHVLLIGQVCHGTLELGDDRAGMEGACREYAELGLASAMGVAGGVGDLDGAGWKIELEVARCMSDRGGDGVSHAETRRRMDGGDEHTWRTR